MSEPGGSGSALPDTVKPTNEVAPVTEPAAEPPTSTLVADAGPQRFTGRFATVYTTLGIIGAAAIAGLIVLLVLRRRR